MKKDEKTPYNGDKKTLNRVSKQGKRIRIQFDIDYHGDPGKVMNSKSETVPDMNLTVRQLLEHHTRGQSSEISVKQPLYFETEIPTIRDITDVKKYREHLEYRLNEVNKFVKKEAEEAADKKAKAAKKASESAVKEPQGDNKDASK